MAGLTSRLWATVALLFVISLAAFDTQAAAFTPGNLVIYRIGDGSATLASPATPAFLDEYTTAGVLVQSIALPTTVNGANKRATGSGTATSEGLISRSVDGQYLVAVGYDAAVGTTSVTATTSAAVNRVVARVAADGSIDTTTALTDAHTGSNPRGVATNDGTAFWTTGGAGGIRYSLLGGTTSVQLSTTTTNLRGVGIFGSQLYISSGSGTTHVATVGSGIPTTNGQTITNLPGYPTTGSQYQFFFADLSAGVAGVDTLYVVDDTAGNIQKYSLVAGTWTANGTVSLSSVRGLTATVNAGVVTLYVTNGSTLQTLTDSSGYNATISGALSSLATAPTNTAFRGIAFAPVQAQFALNVSHNGSGTGTTTSTPGGTINCVNGTGTCSANLANSSTITLSATPDAGSHFAGWSGACSGTGTCMLTMDAVKNVTATYNLDANYLLTVGQTGTGSGIIASVPLGTINCQDGAGTCSASLPGSTVVTLAATANNISAFTGWSGDCTGTGSCMVTMDAAKNVTANFDSSVLTMTHNGTGTGVTTSSPSGINCSGATGTCSAGFVPNTMVTLSATPSGSASFTGWSGACMGTGTCMVTMDVAKSVTATFDLSVTRIHTVQGSTSTSPYAGQQVLVQGIVTANFQGAGQLSGFFIQEPDALADADPTTSEGIFVYTNASPVTVAVGDLVQVVGTVSEFGTAPDTLTEIVTPTVSVLSSGNPLPAAVVVNLPVASLSDMERYEGMRVQFNQTLTVIDNFDLAHFGEITLSANGRALQSTNEVDLNDNPASGTTSSGNSNQAAVNAYEDLNVRSSFVLDDGSSPSYPSTIPFVDGTDHTLRLGSTLSSLTGIFSQSFGAYRVYATTTPSFNYAARPATPPVVGGNLKVASANVLNYFNGNGATGVFPTSRGANSAVEFARQRAKVLAALHGLGADVLGLLEVQNNANHATPAIQDIINGLNAIDGAGVWAAMAPPANYGPFGGSGLIPGGSDEIRPAIIYKTAVVAPVGISTSPNDSAYNQARAPIAQTFQLLSNGEQFTFIINHFKSKNSGGTGLDADLGDGQSSFNNARKLQSAALLTFINTLTAGGATRILTMGDYNAYEQEDPIDVLRAGGLTTLVNNNYSFLFNARLGSLDHALANAALLPAVTGADKWHINSDEPVYLDYNVENKNTTGCTSSCTNPDYYTATPYRASDHDPVLVGLNLVAAQTITFGAQGAQSYSPAGTFAVNPLATASSGLTVTYSSLTTGVCTVSGTTVTIVTAGTCTLAADQAGNTNYNAAPQATQSVTINPGAQSITFGTLANATLGDAPFMVGATASSSLVVSFSSLTTAVCTVSSGVVALVGAGTCTVRASQAGNSSYAAAANVDQSFTVAQGPQTITFGALGGKNLGDPAFAVSATASSSLTVTFSSLTTPVCTVSVNTVTIVAVGTCTIRAAQAGNSNYAAAANVDQSFTVGQGGQTITFGALAGKTFGAAAFTVSATASSGLAVTFSSLTSGVCTVATNTVTIVAVGTCTVRAAQAGNASYTAAANVDQSFTVAQATQTISFGALSNHTLGSGSFTVSATGGGSGNPVVFSSTTGAVCTTSGTNGTTVNLLTVGTCTIAANQTGNTNYSAATQVTQSFTVNAVPPTPQVISFAALANRAVNSGSFAVSASGGGSGNAVTFTASPATVCTSGGVNGSTISLVAIGICTVTANQAGNATYAAATPVTQSFAVLAAVPGAPRNLACTAGTLAATCQFDAPLDNGSGAVTGYTLSCVNTTVANPIASTVSGTASPLTATGQRAGALLSCTATASNANGAGPASNVAFVTPVGKVVRKGGIDPQGDGRGKLLVRILSGANAGQMMLGTYDSVAKTINFAGLPDPGTGQLILGVGDLGGDGKSDLLYQTSASGDVSVWSGFDGSADGRTFLRTVKPGWVVEGVSDMDGDGHADIIWRYTGSPLNPPASPDDLGVVFIWFMNGSAIDEIKSRGGAPTTWDLVGGADLHGNGRSDLVYLSPAGAVRCITGLTGRNFVNELVGTTPTGFKPVRLGDFDGDGKADILFRNSSTGQLKLWLMNGITISSQVDMPAVDATWELFATADVNGDGVADIIFKKPDGTLVIWLMTAGAAGQPTVITNAGAVPSGYVNIDP